MTNLVRFMHHPSRPLLSAVMAALLLAAVAIPPGHAEETFSPDDMRQLAEEMRQQVRDNPEFLKMLDPEQRRNIERMMSDPNWADEISAGMAEEEKRQQTRRDAISSQVLDGAALKRHVEGLPSKLSTALTPEVRARAEAMLAGLGQGPESLEEWRATASGLGVMGAWPEAVWLMARVALASGSAQDLNNLAALLTLLGAQPAALPILYTLNARYPNNSTLLNNLGQALFGLGDSAGAEPLLIAAIRRSPQHPQANAALARIQSELGDKSAAQASLRQALQGGFSEEKFQDLRQAGGKLTRDDLNWRIPMPQDPLGLERFTRPAYPRTARELPKAMAEWEAARGEWQALKEELEGKERSLPQAPQAEILASTSAPFFALATKVLQFESEHYQRLQKRLSATGNELWKKVQMEWDKVEKGVEALDAAGDKKYRNVAGGYQFDYTCPDVLKLIDQYLAATIPAVAQYEAEYLETMRRHHNEAAYLNQFVLPPVSWERSKLQFKTGYLSLLPGSNSMTGSVLRLPEGLVQQRRYACFGGPQEKNARRKLPDFDDIHCEHIATLNFPGLGKIVSHCNQLTAELKPQFGLIEAEWALKDTGRGGETRWLNASVALDIRGVKLGGHSEFDTKGIKSGGLSLGVGTEVGKLGAGPLEIGVEAGATLNLEFDRGGIKDLSVGASVETKTGGNFAQTDAGQMKTVLKTEIKGTASWNAGLGGEAKQGFDSSVLDP